MTPTLVLKHLEGLIGADGAPRILAEVIESSLITEFGVAPITATEKTSELLAKVKTRIEKGAQQADEKGVPGTLIMIGMAGDIVCGAYYVMALDTPDIAQAKRNRLISDQLLQHMRSLNFSQFEKFGKRILYELGAGKSEVSPHSNDQGIDFYGEFNFGQLKGLPQPFHKLSHDVSLLFAGQAKHYPTSSLGPNIVRELIGAVSLARTKTHSKDGVDIFKDMNIRPFSPVITLLFTTGNLSSGAVRLASAAGIIAKDGKQLAAFLADQSVGITAGPNGPEFCAPLFTKWLDE